MTLTGTGGVGKTRLGLQVATDLLDDFADGVCFVPLAPISDPDLVVPTIAQALGIKEAGEQPFEDLLQASFARQAPAAAARQLRAGVGGGTGAF